MSATTTLIRPRRRREDMFGQYGDTEVDLSRRAQQAMGFGL
jgi:hypothetical protein